MMSVSDPALAELAERIARLEAELAAFRSEEVTPQYYSVAEFAHRVGRAPYTVREWARQGRIAAHRCVSGGPYRPWVISHTELVRYEQWGLRPIATRSSTPVFQEQP
jgi:hypothetical protein